AKKIMDDVKAGNSKYHIIEIMACPGGCIAGAGQPYHRGDYSIVKSRSEGLYNIDSNKEIRKSHKNPAVNTLYDEFLGNPCGDL
ncbi:iron hydrogenase small subunit, partial [Casaltella massiliensis]|nr:iron hydrogenase small subunit [Casaltella massiliensis]